MLAMFHLLAGNSPIEMIQTFFARNSFETVLIKHLWLIVTVNHMKFTLVIEQQQKNEDENEKKNKISNREKCMKFFTISLFGREKKKSETVSSHFSSIFIYSARGSIKIS